MRSTFQPWCLLGWSLSQCWSACPTWAMPTDLNSVGRMEFSCQAQSFLCSFCSFLVILSSPTSITHTSVFFSLRRWWSLVVTLKNSCSVHYQLAIPAEKEFTNFRLHGQFSPFVDRQASLQFCRSSWNASHSGHGEKGNSLWQPESLAWTGAYSVSAFCGTFSVQIKWWLLGQNKSKNKQMGPT